MYKWLIYVICSSVSEETTFKSTQVETRLPSVKPRRSRIPGPKNPTCAPKNRARLSILPSPISPNSDYAHLQIGQEVTTSDGRVGVLRFKGTTHFTRGFLCGIELYNAAGKNGGTVDGHYYFKCSEPHGVFVPAYKVFPSAGSGLPALNGKSKTSRAITTEPQSEAATSERLPRPKNLPLSGGPLQRDRTIKPGTGSLKASRASTGTPPSSYRKLSARRIGPLKSSVTCPGWLSKSATKSSTPGHTHEDRNTTYTIPGDEQSNLESSYSARRKRPSSRKPRRKDEKVRHVAPDTEPRCRLGSLPSYQDLSSIGGSEEELGTPKRREFVEDVELGSTGTYDVTTEDDDDDAFAPIGSPITFEVGSQGSFGTWEDTSASCGKSNTSLAWDDSTPVEFCEEADREGQQILIHEDFLVADEDEVEYNEFLAIPSSLDTPTGRCKFDLLTPEELEQALIESNLLLPEVLRGSQQDEESLFNLGSLRNTPIWEPITPVEEEFLPLGTSLNSNPLAFWSMDSVPVRTEATNNQGLQSNVEGVTAMELAASDGADLESGVRTVQCNGAEHISVDGDDLGSGDANRVNGYSNEEGQPPCDLLEGVESRGREIDNAQNGDDGQLNGIDGSHAMIELVVADGNPECSDSSSGSNRTVTLTETVNGLARLEELEDNVTDDLKIALKESGKVVPEEITSQNLERNVGTQEKNRKSSLIKTKAGTTTSRKPNVKGETKQTKDKSSKGSKEGTPKIGKPPPVSAKPSVIPRRRTLEPGKASAKLAEVKSRINSGRKLPGIPANATKTGTEKQESKENSSKKEVKATKRTTFHLRTEKDHVRKPSSSSATSDNSRGRADSRGSVSSSRPSSKIDVSSDAKRIKKTNNPPRNTTSSKKPSRTSTVPSQPPAPRRGPQTKERSQENNVTKLDAAPTRRAGFAVPAARKPLTSSTKEVKSNRRQITPKDTKQAKLKKSRPHSGTSTPPDVVYASVPDVHTNVEVNRLEKLCNNQTKQLDTACQQIRVNAKAFETMAVLVQYLTQRCDAFSVPSLKQKIFILEAKVTETSGQIASLQQEIARQGEELDENRRANKEELESMKADHDQDIENLRRDLGEQQQAEVDSLNKSHAEELEVEAERFQRMEQTAETYRDDLEQQQAEHFENVLRLEQEKEQQRVEDQCRHEQAVAKLTGDAKLREQVLQDELLSITFKCENLQDKIRMLEDALQKDSDAKVQAAIEQFRHLPEEVESLKTVLGMKNKEIQEMRIKEADLQKQVSRVAEKDDKIQRLEAKIEDLKALMENKVTYERQLSSEHVILRENFEKESVVNKRLSMENEELQWKLHTHSTVASPGGLTPPQFNPSPVPSSPLTSRPLLRPTSCDSYESGVFSPTLNEDK